jgi:nucleotidyltransferase substrate binding protein (TIGR01987 family)
MSNKILTDFEKAIKRLEEVLELKKTGVVRDSAIKRFELCFDLAWKSIKNYSKIQGIECYSPRECFKDAFQLKLIEHDKGWLLMIDDRNLTTHLYKESEAEKVYKNLPEYLEMFKNLFEKLKSA